MVAGHRRPPRPPRGPLEPVPPRQRHLAAEPRQRATGARRPDHDHAARRHDRRLARDRAAVRSHDPSGVAGRRLSLQHRRPRPGHGPAVRRGPTRRSTTTDDVSGTRRWVTSRSTSTRAPFASPPVSSIDAGGIGKGLAADLAVAQLLRSGADGALVSIGGDISMGGCPPEGGWTIDDRAPGTRTRHPREPRRPERRRGHVEHSIAALASRRKRAPPRHRPVDRASPRRPTCRRSPWSPGQVAGRSARHRGDPRRSSEVIEYLDRHELSGLAVTNDHRVLATDDLAELRREPATVR